MPLALAVYGITGRMGQSLVSELRDSSDWRLRLAMASPDSTRLGADAALSGSALGVAIRTDDAPLGGIQVALDFSVSEAVASHAKACLAAQVPLLVGTTALTQATLEELKRAGERVAVLVAPNTSVGVSVLVELARRAASGLGAGFDVEISEVHHHSKRDAPSGTALALGEAVASARGAKLSDLAVYERHGRDAKRSAGSIGFSSQRLGDVVGEHTVYFGAPGERLELTHRASDRRIFARGALTAAAWLVKQPPGLYGMRDMLNI
jgi:4-hydroxy-tetrahydrodipicolinate reductase